MSDRIIRDAAPEMGSFEQGIESFKQVRAPYARGGGTPATAYLEQQCTRYLGNFTMTVGAAAPSAVIFASGQAANHTVFNALRGGDLVSSSALFGTTRKDILYSFERDGGGVSWVDPCDTQAFIDASTEKTTAWFLEVISNPAGRVPDLEALGKAAQERDILLILDTTLAAGMPKFDGFKYAPVLTNSLTKQASGGDNRYVGGVAIVRGDIAWEQKLDRYPELKRYFKTASGDIALPPHPFAALLGHIGLHEGSCVMSPDTAVGIAETLPDLQQRVAKQCQNARVLAQMLTERSDIVSSVKLAGFHTDHDNDDRTRKYLGDNHFMILFDMKGEFEAARRFIDSAQFMHAVALGQKATAVSNPASSTHRAYTDQQRAAMGIGPGTLRLSVGTEDESELRDRMAAALG